MARQLVRCPSWQALIVGSIAILGNSQVTAQSVASQYTTGYRYDMGRREVGAIQPDPDGAGPIHFAATRSSYDTRGVLVRVEQGELATWQSDSVVPSAWTGYTVFQQTDYTYDVAGRRVSEQVSAGGVAYQLTQYSYDSDGRLDCTAERMNQAAFATDLATLTACQPGGQGSFGPDRISRIGSYDTMDRVLSKLRAYGTASPQTYVTYTYSGNHEASLTDANGNNQTFQVDGFGRRTSWNFPSPNTVGATSTTDNEQYTYDSNGNQLTRRTRGGVTITYTYDALNRQSGKHFSANGTDVYYGFDLRNLKTYSRFASNTGVGITNTYDGFGRLSTTANNMGSTTLTLTYGYDADGSRTSLKYPDANNVTYAYDGLGRLSTIAESGTTTLVSVGYDSAGLTRTLTRGGVAPGGVSTTTLQYDGIDRVQSLSQDLDGTSTSHDLTQSFTYSPSDQIATQSFSNGIYAPTPVPASVLYVPNGLNQYSTIFGAQTTSPTYDTSGNLANDGSVAYSYDAENHLVGVSGNRTATLTYDPEGRLYEITDGTLSGDTRFLYDGDALVSEYSGTGTLLRRYVHADGGDSPVVWYEGSGFGATNRYYYYTNYQGSIVAISNNAGTWTRTNTYDEYGNLGSGNGGSFQYAGQVYLPQLNLYYYKARLYSPSLGRFLQTDPVGLDPDPDLYAYVGNDPVNDTDSSGLCSDNELDTPCQKERIGEEAAAQLEEIVVTAKKHHDVDLYGAFLDYWPGASLGNCIYQSFSGGSCGGGGTWAMAIIGAIPGEGVEAKAVAAVGKGLGIIAKNGTRITGLTRHGVNRVIGNAAERAGTKPQAILDALKNPTKVVEGVDSQGRPFQIFTGANARVVVNPETGRIVSTNPL